LKLPYGDQAFFVTKATFEQLGKFPQVPLMEDFIFIRTAAMKEAHIAVVYQPVITSSRRWQKFGIWKTTVLNNFIVLCYYLGVPLEVLAKWYRLGASDRLPR